MAPIAKKTYSRKLIDLEGSKHEKENIDPFDELLSSPLKQEVHFKPLGFFTKKLKDSQKNYSWKKCRLFEISDPDIPYSPNDRKKKMKLKALESRSNKNHTKKISHKSQNDNTSSTESCIKLTNSSISPVSNTKKISTINRDDSFCYVTVRNRYKEACEMKYNPLIWSDTSSDETSTLSTSLKVSSQKCQMQKLSKPHNELKRNIDLIDKKEVKNKNNEKHREHSDTLGVNFSCFSSPNFTPAKIQCEFPSMEINSCRRFFQQERITNVEDQSCFENSVTLKYKKKWLHSMSLLKAFQNKNIFGDNVNARTQGRKFENLVQDIMEMQNEKEVNDTNISNTTLTNSTLENTSDDSFVEGLNAFQSNLKYQPDDSENQEDKGTQSELSHLKDVSNLTTLMSDMTIRNDVLVNDSTLNISLEASNEKSSACQANEKNSNILSVANYPNVTMRRRNKEKLITSNTIGVSTRQSAKVYKSMKTQNALKKNKNRRLVEDELERTFDISKGEKEGNFGNVAKNLSSKNNPRISLDSSKLSAWGCPIFESTRIQDEDYSDKEDSRRNSSLEKLEETSSGSENFIVLKSGKKWQRSISVLKKLQNGRSILDYHEETRVKGRNCHTFIQDLIDMQKQVSSVTSVMFDSTISDKTFMNTTIKKKPSDSFDDKSSIFTTTPELQYKNSEEEDTLKDSSNQNDCFRSSDISIFVSLLSATTGFHKTLMNYTIKVIEDEISNEKSSAFRSALRLDRDVSSREETTITEDSVITAKDFVLLQCGQKEVLPFEQYFNERTLKNCKKIGEGVYGEVFMCNSDTVIKVIPIEGADKVNGEPQKKFEEILSEVVISSKLSNLRKGERYQTSGFSEMKRCWCVIGKYPKLLKDLWNEYDQLGNGSENDSPVMFKSDQLYIILELANGGKDLESYVFNSSEQSLSIFIQTAFSLAIAEKAFEFEHRDLHWGNLLISRTKDKFKKVVLDGVEYQIPTKGVQVSIIDFTLSRMSHEGCYIFNDLSVDPTLFVSQGDYQFEIYRMMQREVKNDWSLFRPKNNLYWLHYVLDKMLKSLRYKNTNTQVHKKFMEEIKMLESVILDHGDTMDFVLTEGLI